MKDVSYPNSYGLLLRYRGQNEEAIAQFRAALNIQEGQEWASTNLCALLIQLGRWGEFNTDITKAMAWALERVAGAQEKFDGLITDDLVVPEKLAAAREALEYEQFHAAAMRRLHIEGLRLQRAEKQKK